VTDTLAASGPDRGVGDTEASGLESAAGTPASEGRFPTLDGYRALAAFAVVVVHVGFQTGRSIHGGGHSILARGDIGVPVFFLLSGFLLYRPMTFARLSGRPLPTLRDYLVRRGLRILPAYWVSVVLVMMLLTINAGARHSAGQWAQHLVLVQVYVHNDPVHGLEQDWSLCTELAFYLFLPLWPRLIRRLTRGKAAVAAEFTGLGLLVAVTVVWQVLSHGYGLDTVTTQWLPAHLDYFAAGMGLAVISVLPTTHPEQARRWRWLTEVADSPGTCWLGAAGLFAIAITPAGGPDDLSTSPVWQALTRELLFVMFAVLFLLPGFLGDQRRGWPRLLLRTRVMQRLGEMSYGIFLLHLGALLLVYEWLGLEPFQGNFVEVLSLTVGITIVAAYLSLRLIELPALGLKHRFAPRRDAPAPDPAVAAPAG
jgi:peptidoglycan/LPS O-acetylase OafA/YrhL